MVGYVLQRMRDGAYVARPGSASSYTSWVERARIFPTREAAEREACVENERVVSVDEIFRGNSA
jgi:hypothetical protein